MELVDEIRMLFATSTMNSAYSVSEYCKGYPAWVVRQWEGIGVAIPYDGSDMNEEFANASLFSSVLSIEGKDEKCLFLLSSMELSRNEFATFCRDFISPGENGELRSNLLNDPVDWWRKWKLLIGNTIMEKKPYAVLGELIVYAWLLRNEHSVEWTGPKASSHDIIGPYAEYEVKSTLSRYERIIHVAGQYQLQKTEKKLFLYFCRFEPNINGISINDMTEILQKRYGVSGEDLNGKLFRMGYRQGSSSRDEKYQLHEMLRYEVDDSFPRITPEMLKTEQWPAGIKHLSYDVDLSVLDGTMIDFALILK